MAVFEKGKGIRRFFSLSTDALPSVDGGIPSGSILVRTDTGDRFIYNGDTGEWIEFVGVEDTAQVLEEISSKLDALDELARHSSVIRSAVAALANEWGNSKEHFSGDDN